jgi:hypothetical protein
MFFSELLVGTRAMVSYFSKIAILYNNKQNLFYQKEKLAELK